MRALLCLIALSALATPALAESRQVIGQAGYLGEWELTASVTENVSYRAKEFAGPLTMRHVGLCTQGGPEEKTGEIRLHISESSPQIQATISFDGIACSYSGQLSDSYTGEMNCPDRRAVPLTLWLK